jgi:hypothetical protein
MRIELQGSNRSAINIKSWQSAICRKPRQDQLYTFDTGRSFPAFFNDSPRDGATLSPTIAFILLQRP